MKITGKMNKMIKRMQRDIRKNFRYKNCVEIVYCDEDLNDEEIDFIINKFKKKRYKISYTCFNQQKELSIQRPE